MGPTWTRATARVWVPRRDLTPTRGAITWADHKVEEASSKARILFYRLPAPATDGLYRQAYRIPQHQFSIRYFANHAVGIRTLRDHNGAPTGVVNAADNVFEHAVTVPVVAQFRLARWLRRPLRPG